MGISILLPTLQQQRTNEKDDDNDDDRAVVFYDLGSGVGRLVTQIYLDQPWRIQKSVGIELALDRHELAVQALAGIRDYFDETEMIGGGRGAAGHEDDNDNNGDDDGSDISGTIDSSSSSTKVGDGDDDDSMKNTDNNNNNNINSQLWIEFHHGDALVVDWSDATHVYLSSLCFPKSVLEALQRIILQERPHLKVVAALNRLDVLLQESNDAWQERQVDIQMSWGPAGTAKIYTRVK
jgi:hypothetical protein